MIPRRPWLPLVALVTVLAVAGLVQLPAPASVRAQTPPTDRPAAPGVFEIGLIGDLLYSPREVEQWPAVMADMQRYPLAFIVHDGDFKSGSSPCDDATFADRLARFQAAPHPLIYVPGDNEWTDCHRPAAGGFDPLERLAALRTHFFPTSDSLGQRPLALTRQSDDPRYALFRENVRWVYNDVLFVALNVQGSNNNLGRTPEMDAEYAERNAANLAWLADAFARAKQAGNRAVMVVWQANPWDESVPAEQRTGFTDIVTALEQETRAFPGPVVLVHGDSHYFRIDKPLPEDRAQPRLANFTRVETFGTPSSHWLRVIVNPAEPDVFTFKPAIVPANAGP